MPCNGGHTYSPPDHTSCEEFEKKLIAEHDELTRLLCYLCGKLTGEGQFDGMPDQLVRWWEKHQKLDFRRVTKQMAAWLAVNGDTMPVTLANDFITKARRKHPLSDFHAKWLFKMAIVAVNQYRIKGCKRVKKVSLREKALRKLTVAERKALGLDTKLRKFKRK
jgi:hypothetical protein